MKQMLVVCLLLGGVILLVNCTAAKKTVAPAKVTYAANVEQLVVAHCSPCHLPAKGGKKLPLDNAEAVKANIDDIIARIDKHPGEKGFMPFKRARLSDSTINVFKQWKADGML
ncbi:MAG: hypothetical protein EOO03_05290 [Chitinophagaceae bacterium]|nr:MAG: hypothetical protein EOO03_05290 [Chitinophagaceae bacterium]